MKIGYYAASSLHALAKYISDMAMSVISTARPWLLLLLPCVLSLATLNTSSPYISDAQVQRAGITRQIADTMAAAWDFEQSTWSSGSVQNDPFYQVPSQNASAAPGTLLKLEDAANISNYTLAPGTALSRILFQTRSLNGTAVPASAFVLWPYSPRRVEGGKIPVVAWAHGATGLFANAGPSHLKALSAQFAAPFTLALQGYVVVGPDYAGLGIGKDARGNTVQHEFLSNPSQANDLFYSVQAAQSAFPQLSMEFVVLGHSQGGGAAWAAAQRQAVEPVEGYLGAIAASPVTDLLALPDGGSLGLVVMFVLYSLQNLYPEFDYHDILTPQAARRWELFLQLQAGDGVSLSLFLGIPILQPSWRQNRFLRDFIARTANGGKPIAGPLLVLQGLADSTIDPGTTTRAVQNTCNKYPQSQLQFQPWEGVTHVPVMYTSQQVWLQWIEDRFAGRQVPPRCVGGTHGPMLAPQRYASDPNWIVEGESALFKLAMP